MKKLCVKFKNCYGIQALEHGFDFGNGRPGNKAFAVYAPNGLMKTSFTKTFEKLASGNIAEEERYKRPATSEAWVDGAPMPKEMIYVLKSEIDIQDDSPAITDILVNPESKSRYDAILIDIDKQKIKLISALQKASGVPKKDIEKTLKRHYMKMSGSKIFQGALPNFWRATLLEKLRTLTTASCSTQSPLTF